jgi:predicted DNA-binding transcriptional regulator YafY
MDELREGLEVDRRTAYRIRETLEELNFPIYEDCSSLDGRKRFRFTDSYLKKLPNLSLPELNLTLPELIALYFIRSNRQMFKGTEIERNINAAFEKLNAYVPEGLAERLDKVKTLFVASSKFSKDYSDKEEIIEQLTDAIFRQRTCQIEYHSFMDDRCKQFLIDPLWFFERDGGLYLFVRATAYNHIRTLAVERINQLTPTGETFVQPDDFDPDAMLEETFISTTCGQPQRLVGPARRRLRLNRVVRLRTLTGETNHDLYLRIMQASMPNGYDGMPALLLRSDGGGYSAVIDGGAVRIPSCPYRMPIAEN